jgi:hypothetical protein
MNCFFFLPFLLQFFMKISIFQILFGFFCFLFFWPTLSSLASHTTPLYIEKSLCRPNERWNPRDYISGTHGTSRNFCFKFHFNLIYRMLFVLNRYDRPIAENINKYKNSLESIFIQSRNFRQCLLLRVHDISDKVYM